MSVNSLNTVQNPDEQSGNTDWAILEESQNDEILDDKKELSGYIKTVLGELAGGAENESEAPAISDEMLSNLVSESSDAEQAKQIKRAIIDGGLQFAVASGEEPDSIPEDMLFEYGIDGMLLKAIKNSETDSPEEYVELTKTLAENLGYQIPIQPTEVNMECFGSYHDSEEIEIRRALDHAGVIDSEFKHALITDRTKDMFDTFPGRVPEVFLNPTDELYEYWEEQSEIFGGDALSGIRSCMYGKEEGTLFADDGTISDIAFADDSELMRRIFHDHYSMSKDIVGFINLACANSDKITNSSDRFFIDAMKGVENPDDLEGVIELASWARPDGRFGTSGFDEDGKPNDYFWYRAIKHNGGKYVKLFNGYEEHYSEKDLSFLEIPEDKRVAIMEFIDSLPYNKNFEEERDKFGIALGYVEEDGTLSKKFFEQDILGNAKAEKVVLLFGEQSLSELKPHEVAYCELSDEYRRTLVGSYNRYRKKQRENGEEVKPYREAVAEWMNEDGTPTKEFYASVFDEGRFDLLVHEPLAPIEETGLSETEQKVLEAYAGIKDESLEREYIDFIIENRRNNHTIPTERLMIAPRVLGQLRDSNANEILAHRCAIARQLLRVDLDDDEAMLSKLDEIEGVFVRNGLPMSGKTWSVFSILHKTENLEKDFSINDENEIISPALIESAKTGETAKLIYRDLMKSYLGSSIQTAKYIDILKTRFPDLDTGFDSVEEAVEYSKSKITEAHNRNIEAGRHDLKLEKGDLIKGVGGIRYLGTILENGSNAKEFLGEGADSDTTPLDTDLSRVFEDVNSIEEGIKSLECEGFGPIYFVLKGARDGQERFNVTRRSPLEEGEPTDEVDMGSDKLEAFFTGTIGKHHYGIRTGFASSEIDGILVKSDTLSREVGLEIAMNGFYIPVYDMNGKCIFTPEDYEELRGKMTGLEYYEGMTSVEDGVEYSENSEYHFAEDLTIPGVDINGLAGLVSEAREETTERHEAIDAVFAQAFSELGLRRKDYIDGNLEPGSIEVSDTGSTGRGTNVPHDGDFDYMFRIDRADKTNPARVSEIREAFLRALGKEDRLDDDEVAYDNIIRLKHVNIPGIEGEIEIDITMEQKTNRTRYSTDESLRRRIAAMRLENPEKADQAIANIIFAKKFCKSVGAYKPDRTRDYPKDEKGGLGGVGVENWILQNGGSFVEAAKAFVAHARNEDGSIKSFDVFKASFALFDFGQNHMAKIDESQHDNFVTRNMNEGGYNRLVRALIDFVDTGKFPDGLSVN